VRRLGFRPQRTLAATAEVRGVGFVTGASVRLRFHPAAPDTGLVFLRSDLASKPRTPARPDRVTNTNRRTTLGSPDSGVTLAEHALAALAGLRIDNCLVEIDGPEPPGLDGSASGFVAALTAAGVAMQSARRAVWGVAEPVVVTHGSATIALHPPTEGPHLRASYLLDYGPRAAIPRQAYTTLVTPETFARDVAGNRTFLLESEANSLRQQGVGKHLTASQLLVFGPTGPIENQLRHADEPARHKVLDLIGDLSLCGFDLAGHLVAYRSGHALNVALAAALVAAAAKGLTADGAAATPPRAARRRVAAA
jgi:UDP-3-O-acyl N-acetylglucosamine deacetylase